MSLGAGQEPAGSRTAAEGAPGPAQLLCSAKACRATATTYLTWRNPSLHHGGRVKHWLACDGHADFLADFLDRRGFLLERGPLTDAPGNPPPSEQRDETRGQGQTGPR